MLPRETYIRLTNAALLVRHRLEGRGKEVGLVNPTSPLYLGVAQFGSVTGLGPVGREFESHHLDHHRQLPVNIIGEIPVYLRCLQQNIFCKTKDDVFGSPYPMGYLST